MPDGDLVAIRMRLTGGSQVAAEAKEANAAIAETGATAKAAGAESASASTKIAKSAMSLKSVGRGLSTYLSLPIAGIGIASGAMALDFDRSMRNVNSIAQLPEKRFERLKQQVLDLAGPTAQSPKTLAEGLYDLVSSGFDANESLKILRAGALAASAGLTTTEVSTKAVAAVLNAYQLPASMAGKVSDQLFETVNRGVLSFEELSTTIGDVLPFASQLGVGLDQVGAAVSTMTKAGLGAPETMTRIKNVLVTLIKPGKGLSELFDEMNTTGEKLVEKRGLQGALEAIIAHTNGSKEAVAELFPNIRAMGGVLSLTGDNAKRAAEDVAAFKTTTGATAKALSQQEQSFGFKLQRGWAELQAVLIEIGSELLPIVVPFLVQLAEAAGDAVHWFAQLPQPLQNVGIALGIIALAAGPLLVAIGSLVGAFITLDVAASPWLAIVAGVIALGAAFYVAYESVSWFRTAVDFVWKFFKVQILMMFAPIVLLIMYFGNLKGAVLDVAAVVAGAFADATQWVGNAITNIGHFFSRLPGMALSAVEKIPGIIWGALKQTPALLAKFIVFFLLLPVRIPVYFVKLQIRIVSLLIHLGGVLLGLGGRAATSLLHGLIAHGPAVIMFFVNLQLRIFVFMATLPVKMVQLGIRIVTGLVHGLISAAPQIFGWARGLAGKFAGAVAATASAFFSVGKEIASQIAHGLASGLTDLLPGPVKNALEGAAGVAGEVGGFINPFASGTNFAPGGLSLVGEAGPEIVNLPRGSQVVPAARTKTLLAPFNASPKPAALAAGARGGDGRGRILVPVVVKVGNRELTSVVVETTEDAEARL